VFNQDNCAVRLCDQRTQPSRKTALFREKAIVKQQKIEKIQKSYITARIFEKKPEITVTFFTKATAM